MNVLHAAHLNYFPCDVLITFRLEEAESRVLSFLLEFINWKALPSTLLHILSQRAAENTWTPHKHFGKEVTTKLHCQIKYYCFSCIL